MHTNNVVPIRTITLDTSNMGRAKGDENLFIFHTNKMYHTIELLDIDYQKRKKC